MISCPGIEKKVIRNHYDISTLFYRLLWGPHIHHGYWEANEAIATAQVNLTRRLAKMADLPRDGVGYDIGCGMGGSSQWLAKELGCSITGVTLSPVQHWWASQSAFWSGVKPRPRFRCADAEQIEFDEGSADFVWSIECTEHLFEKPRFFQRAAGWLKPGGKFALCAWLAGHEPLSLEQANLAQRVCEGMFCPSLGTLDDYIQWFREAGMKVTHSEIWTRQVEQTWEICQQRVEKSGMRWLARLLGPNHVLFLDRFEAILKAYRTGAMEYGALVAEKD
jgi:tocopherol O-methyltransferase